MISSAKSSFIAAFADELKRAREYSGISTGDVFARTHVSRAYIEALEEGRWEEIPQPYLRGYLSLYAQAVGMNLDKVLKGFDQLMSAQDDADLAMLDASSPLLRQPEHIGVTRAKIRAGWFTAITQNRKSSYLVLVASIAVLATGLYLSRRAQRPQFTLAPFQATVEEYGQSVKGPLTHIYASVRDSAAHMSKPESRHVLIIGSTSGCITVRGRGDQPRIIRYQPYDSLVIYYDTTTYVSVAPMTSAIMVNSRKEDVQPKFFGHDTAYYILAEEYLARPSPPADTVDRP